jgi:group I intron endonuclease
VGYTSQSFLQRKYYHIYAAKAEKPKMVIARAIKKYGADNFRFDVVNDNLSIDEAWQLEERLIAELLPEYNVSSGGKAPGQGVRWTEERRRHYSAVRTGKKYSAEIRARMKAAQNARDHSAYCKRVICLDDGVVYLSTRKAAEAYGLRNKSRVINVCRGWQYSDKGKHFAYYHDSFSEADRIKLLAEAVHKRLHKYDVGVEVRRRPVICLNDGRQYSSVTVAAEAYGISNQTVSNVCKTGKSTRSSLRFAYYEASSKAA